MLTYSFYSVILGRAIKNEYLAIGTLLGTAGLTFAAMGGSKKDAHAPSGSGKQTIAQVKESVKFNAGSRCVHSEFHARLQVTH